MTNLRCGTTHGQDSWVETFGQIKEEKVRPGGHFTATAHTSKGVGRVQNLEKHKWVLIRHFFFSFLKYRYPVPIYSNYISHTNIRYRITHY